MLLVAVFVLTNTVSADGSISGVYSASLRLAEQSAGSNGRIKKITQGLKELVGGQRQEAQPGDPTKSGWPAKPATETECDGARQESAGQALNQFMKDLD